MKLNPALKDFWTTKASIKILYGGRMSSKSYDTAGILLYLASKYKLRILCIRRYQNKIEESVYALLKELILSEEYFKQNFTILQSSIRCNSTGSEFIFFGLHRSMDEVVGLQNINVTWCEEAHSIQEKEWNKLRPTILRQQNSFCIMVFNPQYDTDFVYKNFVMQKREDTLVRHINYIDNPFLSNSAKDLIAIDKKHLDEDEYNHIYLGYPKKDDEQTIIKRAWIDACIDAHIKLGIEPTGAKKIGFDIADDGTDTNATVLSHGVLVYGLDEWKAKEDELFKSSKRAYLLAQKEKAIINYDCIGVGASAGSHFKEFNEKANHHGQVKYYKFDAGAKVQDPDKEYQTQVKNKDYFLNLKAQAWWSVADRMKMTYNAITKNEPYDKELIISISSDIPKLDALREQLSIPKKVVNSNFKNQVEPKKELLKRGVPSPNLADAFIMSNFRVKLDDKVGLSSKMF